MLSTFSRSIRLLLLPLAVAVGAATFWAPYSADPAQIGSTAAAAAAGIELQTPAEAAVYYEADDVYLISNFGSGGPATIDNDGFISRIDAETQEIIELEWIRGTLSAPKGMTIVGGTLYVADLDAVEMYDLGNGGAALGQIPVDTSQVTFPNDVCAGADGTVYLTDTGLNSDFSPSGTDAVYRIVDEELVQVAAGADVLKSPNGCWVDDAGVLVVTFGANEVLRIGDDGSVSPVAELPNGSLDGIVAGGGGYFVTSWEAGSVFRFDLDSVESTVAATDTPSPAALGYDSRRNRLIVPLLQMDQGPPFTVDVIDVDDE